MPLIKSRTPFNVQNPYRPERPATKKIIFLSLEGSATEEEYFDRISELFSEVRTKIQFISVAEDAVHTAPKRRTPEQLKMLSEVRPKQLVERIDQFKIENNEKYQFALYPDDEFWVVTDVDKNWSDEIIDLENGKTYKDEWNDAIDMCQRKNYRYAISNPFFEIWLLLHHDTVNDEDKNYAVTDTHAYEKTDHFRIRLRDLGVPLKDKKHIKSSDYDEEKLRIAISRAKELHLNKTDLAPKYFATTVYILLEKVVEMMFQNNQEKQQ